MTWHYVLFFGVAHGSVGLYRITEDLGSMGCVWGVIWGRTSLWIVGGRM